MSDIVIRTSEKDLEFALMVHRMASEAPNRPMKEAYYALKNPKIKEFFPDLSFNTLQTWCMDGKIGKMGTDGKYHVKLSEIENFLFKK